MRTYFFTAISALFILVACSDTKNEPIRTPAEKGEEIEKKQSYDHILNEAYGEQKSIHYFDPNVMVYERMVLSIEINENGAFRLNGRSSSFDELATEMRLFYFANKDLGQRMTNVHRDDEFYKYKHYPFFVYFNKAGFQSYLDRLKLMAKNDSIAEKYLKNHQSRFKSFDVVEEGIVLPFLEFGAFISIRYQEETGSEAIAKIENKVAENIHAFRNEIALEEFGTSYERIRDMARKEDSSKMQLIYLKEMVPAYIMKGSADKVPTDVMTKSPLPTSSAENIVIKENEPD